MPLVGWLMSLVLLTFPLALRGAPPDLLEGAPRQAFVPADKPDAWPKGPWHPVPTDEFRRYWNERGAASSTGTERSTPYIERARYEATLVGNRLDAGTLTWTIARQESTDEPLMMLLDETTLPIHDLRWGKQAAVWGTTAAGNSMLVVGPGNRRLAGRWNLHGENSLDRLTFNLRLPRALMTVLRVELPAHQRIECAEGLVTPDRPSAGGLGRWWTITLGRRSSCRLRVVDPPDPQQAQQTLVARSTSYSVRADGLHVQAEFDVTFTGPPPGDVTFAVPTLLQVESVTLDGDLPLVTRRRETSAGSQLEVRLPDVSSSSRARIRLRGLMKGRAAQRWLLPNVRMLNATLRSGQVSVSVDPPLEVKGYRTRGCRQLSTAAIASRAQPLMFQLWTDKPEIIINIGTPQTDISAQCWTTVDLDADVPTLAAQIEWRAEAGLRYSLECTVPSGWHIADVMPATEVLTSAIADWHVESPINAPSRLVIEFAEPLVPQSSVRVRVDARHSAMSLSATMSVPVLVPVNVNSLTQRLLIATAADVTIDPSPASDWTARLADDLDESWPAGLRQPSGANTALHSLISTQFDAAGQISLTRTAAERPSNAAPSSQTQVMTGDVHETRAEQDIAGFAHLALHSHVSPQRLVHHARYEFLFPTPVDELQLTLPPQCEIVGVLLDGVALTWHTSAESLHIELPTATQTGLLELRYSAVVREQELDHSGLMQDAFVQTSLVHTSTVPLVRFPVPLVQFDWTTHTANGLTSRASALHMDQALMRLKSRWSTRLFGPLGRDDDAETFDPFSRRSWQWLLRTNLSDELAASVLADEAAIHSRQVLSSGIVPDCLSLTVWNLRTRAAWAWLLVSACLLIGVLLRRQGARFRVRLLTYWLPACIVAGWLLPDGWSIFAGSCTVGTLLATALPRRWIVATTTVSPVQGSEGSTQSFPVVATTSLIALLLLPTTWAVAQSDATRPAAPPADTPAQAADATYDVLIPVSGDRPTLDDVDFVYVNDRIFAEMKRPAEPLDDHPALLVRSVDYAIQLPSSSETGTAEIEATLNLLLVRDTELLTLMLPFSGVRFPPEDACRVDGEPVDLVPQADGSGIAIPLSVLHPMDDDSSEVTMTAPRSITVTLRCSTRPSDAGTAPGGVLQIGIPPVLTSHATISASRTLRLTSGGSSVDEPIVRVPISDEGTADLPLGHINQLRLEWSPSAPQRVVGPTNGSTPANRSTMVRSMVDVGPLAVRVSTQFDPHLQARGVNDSTLRRSVTLHLPPTAVVQNVRWNQQPAEYVERRGQASVALIIDISDQVTAQAAPLVIEYELTGVTRSIAGEKSTRITLPPLALFSANSSAAGSTPATVHDVLFRAQTGYALESIVANQALSTTEMLTPDDWTDESAPAWYTGRAPALGYRLRAPGELQVDLRPIASKKTVEQQQRLMITASHLDWTCTSRVVIEGAPAYQHELTIAPDMTITSASVVEDGAERLVRWTRTKQRLILFLSTSGLGEQTISLSGRAPISVDVPTALPPAHITGADVSFVERVVSHSPGVTVELVSPVGRIRGPQSDGNDDETSGAIEIGRFIADRPESPTHFVVLPSSAGLAADSIIRVQETSPQSMTLDAVIRLLASPAVEQNARLHIPGGWALEAPAAEGAEVSLGQPDAAGARLLDVAASAIRSTAMHLRLSTQIDVEGTELIDVPRPRLLEMPFANDLLLLPADTPWQPAGATRLDDLPTVIEDSTALPADIDDPSESQIWELPSTESIRLMHQEAALNGARGLQTHLVEHLLWCDYDRQSAGRMTVWLSPNARGTIDVTLAEAMMITAALVDGAWADVDTLTTESARIRLPVGVRQPEQLVMWWRHEGAPATTSSVHPSAAIPVLSEGTAETVIVSVARPPGEYMRLDDAVESLSPVADRLARFEALLAELSSRSAQPVPLDGPLLMTIRGLEQALVADLSPEPSTDELTDYEEHFVRLHNIWQTLQTDIQVADRSVTDDASPPTASVSPATSLGRLSTQRPPERAYLSTRLASDADRLWFWSVDRSLIGTIWMTIVACVVLPLVPSLTRRFSHWHIAERLGGHPSLAVALIGLVWWFALAHSVVGFGLILFAVGMVISQRRSRALRRTITIGH